MGNTNCSKIMPEYLLNTNVFYSNRWMFGIIAAIFLSLYLRHAMPTVNIAFRDFIIPIFTIFVIVSVIELLVRASYTEDDFKNAINKCNDWQLQSIKNNKVMRSPVDNKPFIFPEQVMNNEYETFDEKILKCTETEIRDEYDEYDDYDEYDEYGGYDEDNYDDYSYPYDGYDDPCAFNKIDRQYMKKKFECNKQNSRERREYSGYDGEDVYEEEYDEEEYEDEYEDYKNYKVIEHMNGTGPSSNNTNLAKESNRSRNRPKNAHRSDKGGRAINRSTNNSKLNMPAKVKHIKKKKKEKFTMNNPVDTKTNSNGVMSKDVELNSQYEDDNYMSYPNMQSCLLDKSYMSVSSKDDTLYNTRKPVPGPTWQPLSANTVQSNLSMQKYSPEFCK